MKAVQQLELDLLLFFYNFSDQHGVVDISSAKIWAKNKLGIHIPNKPITLVQRDFDVLMDKGIVPDTRELLNKFALSKKTT